MEDLTPYLGQTFGYNEGQCDCLTLCKKYYKAHGYKEDFTDGDEGYPTSLIEFERIPSYGNRLTRYLIRHFKPTRKIEELEIGDIVLFEINGDMHTGIFVANEQVLCMQVPCEEGVSTSCVYKKRFWSPYFKYGFKRRKGDN